MRNYNQTTENYLRTAGAKLVYVRDQRGELKARLVTDKQAKELRARGVQLHDSK